jgi:ketosteroid isomerase-like protein
MKAMSCVVVGIALASAALGQTEPMQGPTNAPGTRGAEEHPRVITMTRTAALFGGLESEVFDAVEKKDAAALEKLLARDFELRHAEDPGTPEARAEVIRRKTTSFTLRSYLIGEIAVHSYGTETAVVSFLYVDTAEESGKKAGGSHMMVDVWRQEEGAWKLAVRYVAPSTAKAPTRPTGKE